MNLDGFHRRSIWDGLVSVAVFRVNLGKLLSFDLLGFLNNMWYNNDFTAN